MTADAAFHLRYSADAVELQISDNGNGFDPTVLSGGGQSGAGFGLLGMRERMANLHGSLTLRNDSGALVLASIPRPIEADLRRNGALQQEVQA